MMPANKFPCEAAKNEMRELHAELTDVQQRVLASMTGLSLEQQLVADGMFDMITAVLRNHLDPMVAAWEHHQPRYRSTEAVLARMMAQRR